MCECAESCDDSVSTVTISLEAISEIIIFRGKRFRNRTDGFCSYPIAVSLIGGPVLASNI